MRVIAGQAKGIPLQAVPGAGTRPISDRVKEAVFNILGDDIDGARVLDLFAGTGSVGIEALSRGAGLAVFVEKQHRAAAVIKTNLARTHLSAGARVMQADVFKLLAGPPEPFDLIYIAPPQYQGLWLKTLQAVDASPGWLAPGGQVVIQIFPKEFQPAELASLELEDRRQYGSTLICFYREKHSRARPDTAPDPEEPLAARPPGAS
jgi:16S rRNA (guanine(966)-N(2))-methyltransferase RsmD